jgi:hypothetical protein
VRTEFVFERNTACPLGFSRGRNAHFVPNLPIQQLKKHMCLSKEIHIK